MEQLLAVILGIEFDVLRADDPNSGGIWISDSNNNQLLLYSSDGSTVKKVLFKDTQQSNGQCGSATSSVTCRNPQIDPVTGVSVCWDNVCTARGSLGIDRDGNMLVTASSFVQGTWRFKAPIPTPQIGKTYSADTTLHAPPPGSNFSYGPRGIESPRGIAVAADQLIIADTNRILFWNMPSGVDSLSNGKLADGVAGVADFNKHDAWGFQRITAQGNTQLWVLRKSTVETYPLPLTSGYVPPDDPNSTDPNKRLAAVVFDKPIPVLGGGQITLSFFDDITDIEVTADGKFLWLLQSGKSRVLRIRDPLTNPVIDVILGQSSVLGTSCNQGTSGANGNAPLNDLCYPGSVSYDKLGNLFVADHSLEIQGNLRILVFNKDTIPDNPTSVVLAPFASKNFTNIRAWEMAFDSQNHMAVGYNGYGGSRFPGIFQDPLNLINQPGPNCYLDGTCLRDYFSMAYTAAFDAQDNLYIGDLNRGRVLVWKNPFNNPILSPSPTPLQSPSPTPIASPTPTPTPTPTPAGDTQPPSAPGSLTAGAISSSQINLSWTASSDNVGVIGYEVYRNSSLIATITTTTFGDTGLAAQTTYNYYVIAKDGSGNSSLQSNTASATTLAPPTANSGSITGTVFSSSGGTVSGTKVSTFVSGSKKTITANSSGIYNIAGLPQGTYALKFSARGYVNQTVNVTVNLVNVIRDVTLQKR